MFFTSYEFIGFALILFVLYYTICRKFQWQLILVANVIFYLMAGVKTSAFIFITAVTVYGAARLIDKSLVEQKAYIKEHKEELTKEEKNAYKNGKAKGRRVFFWGALAINLGMLFGLKGLNPLGISFYTLMSLGYLIDVYRDTYRAEKNVFKYVAFATFFPLLIQGPIARFAETTEGMYKEHKFDWQTVSFGVERILWGYFKKLVIADRLLPAVKMITGDASNYQGAYVVVVMFLYTIELYADFTGGVDITIGIAQVLGITVAENFKQPYFSTSLKEYWRRWHITMCEWFRNYVFYPVSTSKAMQKISGFFRTRGGAGVVLGKKIPVYLSSLAVWLCTGIWHGTTANFIIWGLLNFAILMISEELEPAYAKFHDKFGFTNGAGYKFFMIVRTFLLVTVLNLFDCYAKPGVIFSLLGSIFTTGNWSILGSGALLEIGLSVTDYIIVLVGIVVMIIVSVNREKEPVRPRIWKWSFAAQASLFMILFVAIIMFGAYSIGYDASQFIYNQF